MSDQPLAGFTVGVTAARRREELSALLDRRGARVVSPPRSGWCRSPTTRSCSSRDTGTAGKPVDDVIVTTAVGLRAWLETADGWGLRDDLMKRLAGVRILTRGPRASGRRARGGHGRGMVAGVGELRGGPAPSSGEGLAGRRIAVQLYGEPAPELTGALRRGGRRGHGDPGVPAGHAPTTLSRLRRLVGQAVAGTVDAITFTSAPAVAATLAVAAEDGAGGAAAGGAAHPGRRRLRRARCPPRSLERAGRADRSPRDAPGSAPSSARSPPVSPLAAPAGSWRRPRAGDCAGTPSWSTGSSADRTGADGDPAGSGSRPGHVVSRAELCGVLPRRGSPGVIRFGDGRPRPDEHAVEMAVARLRRGLGRAGLVETVVKRGYRLACDPLGTENADLRPARPGRRDASPSASAL